MSGGRIPPSIRGVGLSEDQEQIVASILFERGRQDRKWGQQNHPDLVWNGILGEERGEVEKAIIEAHLSGAPEEDIDRELVEMLAVGVAWLEARMRRKREENTPEAAQRRATADALYGDDRMPTDQELGAAITDAGDDGSGWG